MQFGCGKYWQTTVTRGTSPLITGENLTPINMVLAD
jgi:hypothetical protein